MAVEIEMRQGTPGESPSHVPQRTRDDGEDDPPFRPQGAWPDSERNAKLAKFGGAAALVVALITIIAVLTGGGSSETGGTNVEPPYVPSKPPEVHNGDRLPFSSAIFRETAKGDGLTEWKCACLQDCEDRVVRKFLKKSGQACPADEDSFLASNHDEDCRLATPFMVRDAANGRSCITFDAVKDSCHQVIDKWWTMKFKNGKIDTEALLDGLARDLRDYPLMKWAETERKGQAQTTAKDFLDYAVPRCVEVALRSFAGGSDTLPGGKGLLHDVFGAVKSMAPPFDLAFLTYGWKRDSQIASEMWNRHSEITVSGVQVKEHHGFKVFRQLYQVPHDFLANMEFQADEKVDSGSGSVLSWFGAFVIKCEDSSDWHSEVDWRAFHVIADEYFTYMEKNPDSLLPRFFSAWFGKIADRDYFCWAMQSWIPTSWSQSPEWSTARVGASFEWDLKGSIILERTGETNSRYVERGEVPYSPAHPVPMKDLNFVADKTLVLTSHVRAQMLTQFAKDVEWLTDLNMMDYSIYLLRIKVSDSDEVSMQRVCPRNDSRPGSNKLYNSFFQRDAGFTGAVAGWDDCIYLWAIGMIDILQPWSFSKALGTARNHVLFPMATGKRALNNVMPEEYSQRLKEFMNNISTSDFMVKSDNGDSTMLHADHIYKKCAEFRAAEAKDPHLPLCETLQLENVVPEAKTLQDKAAGPFTSEEVEAARKECRLLTAPCTSKPVAIYVMGPSAVGKSTASEETPGKLNPPLDPQQMVIVDGDILRSKHKGFNDMVALGRRYGCISQHAWDGVRNASKAEKNNIFREAAGFAADGKTDHGCRHNLIIPATCRSFKSCRDEINKLKAHGYTIHVISVIAPRKDVLERGRTRADREGKHYTGLFKGSLVSEIALMALGNGECKLIDNSPRPGVTAFDERCPNQEEYDPWNLPEWLQRAKSKAMEIAGVSEDEMVATEQKLGVDPGSLIAGSFCKHGKNHPLDHVPDEMLDVMDQINQLCKQEEEKGKKEVPLRFQQLDTGTGGGGELFTLQPQGPLKHSVVLKSLHEQEQKFWEANFAEEPPRRESYIVPFGAVWQAFGKTWCLSPSTWVDGANLSEQRRYDIKGVPTLRYFKSGEIGRDPNWIADYLDKQGEGAGLGVAQEDWDKLITRLAEDLTFLQRIDAIDYSMLVSVFPEGTSVPNVRNSVGKRAWQAFNFAQDRNMVVLFGGIIDYLETAHSERDGRVVGENINRALVSSPGMYACRLLFFIATQMLVPCSWPKGDEAPDRANCIHDWGGAFQTIFGESDDEYVSEGTFLVKACLRFDDTTTIMNAVAHLIMYVNEQLEHSKPCIRGFRAAEHCEEKFTYKGEEFTQCSMKQFEYKDIAAPWCSWTPQLPEDSGWDGPWSYCTRCFNDCSVSDGSDTSEQYPCSCGKSICHTNEICSKDSDECSEFGGDVLVKEFCKVGVENEFPGLDKFTQELSGQLKQACDDTNGGESADIVQLDAKAFMLKPQGALTEGAEFQALSDVDLEFYRTNFEGSPPEARSYIMPLLGTFKAFGQQWAVLPASPLGDKLYKIRGIENYRWKSDFPVSTVDTVGLAIAQEDWEKLAILLTEDVTRLEQASAIFYNMNTVIFRDASEDDLKEKTLRGRHMWRVHDWRSGGNMGLLMAGIEEYFQDSRSLTTPDQTSEGVYACRFVLFIMTQMLAPCRWPREVDSPEESKCVVDFSPAVEKIMGEGDVPKASDQNYLKQVCEKVDSDKSLMGSVGSLLMHVVDQLDSDKPCVNGFRAPEHCQASFKYNGKEYTGCVSEPFEDFTDIKAPWCSWESELQSGSGWDGPWSYCARCDAETLEHATV